MIDLFILSHKQTKPKHVQVVVEHTVIRRSTRLRSKGICPIYIRTEEIKWNKSINDPYVHKLQTHIYKDHNKHTHNFMS